MLDLVTAEVKDLQSGLGADDRAIVNDYLDSVREIERRIQLLKARDLSSLDLPEIPVAVSGFDERLRLQFDLLALAYQTNTTRIATFMMCAEVSNQSYAHVGVPDAFHPLSHHAESKPSMEKLAIFSGVLWATSSMSIPPSVEATKATRELSRSTKAER